MSLWISHPRDADAPTPPGLEQFDPDEAHGELACLVSEEMRRLREILAVLIPLSERALWERELVAGMDVRELDLLRSALRMPRFADTEGHARELADAQAELEIVEELRRRLATAPAGAKALTQSRPPNRLESLIAGMLEPRLEHRLVVRYLARQARLGRHLAEAMQDPYVVNRLGEGERRRLVEDATLLAAWHAALEDSAPQTPERPLCPAHA